MPKPMSTINLKGLFPEEIKEFVDLLGVPGYRATQLAEWIYGHGVSDFSLMTNLPVGLRDQLAAEAEIETLEVETAQVSRRDGTAKYLFRCSDGALVESVWLPHDYGGSVCVSTQVGCRQGCRFCASGLSGWQRNLTAGEIFDQVLQISLRQPKEQHVRNVVFMGMGEPLDNFGQVVKAIRLLHLPMGLGIGYRRQTVSTSGIIPGIERLAGEGLPVTLSVSLHAADDELRSRLMPVGRKYPIGPLLEACDAYGDLTGRRVTYEYILIQGVNDSREQALALGRLLKGRLAHVNLIPANTVPERDIKPPASQEAVRFRNILEQNGLSVTLRREMGGDIDAACGQLRRRSQVGELG